MTPPPNEPPGFKPQIVAGKDLEEQKRREEMTGRITSFVQSLIGVAPAVDPNDKSVFEVHPPLLASAALLPRRQWIGGPEGFTPGTVALISGPPKSYKSTLALTYAITLASGAPWAGLVPERPYRVLYCGWEDRLEELQRRAHGIMDRQFQSWAEPVARNLRFLRLLAPLLLTVDQFRPPTVGPDWAKLVRTVEALDVEFMILDTLADLHDGDDISNMVMRAVSAPLRELASGRNMPVAAVAHDRKDTNGTSLDRIRGGSALGGVIRRHIPVRHVEPEQAREMNADRLIQVEPGSNQYGAPSPERFFSVISHEIANGDLVPVLEPFKPPAGIAAANVNSDMCNRLVAAIAIGYAGEPLSDHRNAGPRSFYAACQANGLTDHKAQSAALIALKRDYGVVVGRYAKPRKSKEDAPTGLRTSDGKPDGVRWLL